MPTVFLSAMVTSLVPRPFAICPHTRTTRTLLGDEKCNSCCLSGYRRISWRMRHYCQPRCAWVVVLVTWRMSWRCWCHCRSRPVASRLSTASSDDIMSQFCWEFLTPLTPSRRQLPWLTGSAVIDICARAVLAVVILSVCPSLCLSHVCFVTKLNDALLIFWYHTKGESLCYSDINSGRWATPPSIWNLFSKWPTPSKKRQLQQITAYNVSTVRDSQKSSIITNIKLTSGFSMSYRWSERYP